MEKLIINSYEEFASHLGEQIGTSEWLEVSQERINLFADATLDHQWIHVDTDRAKVESPYKSTIAHGYLTLSLLPHLWQEIMRFGQPVLSGQRVRLSASLHDISNIRGICKAQIKFKLEIEGQKKQALEGLATFLYYFK